MKRKVIVIGSGIAGLAVSIRLKIKGYDVEVYEKNDNVGGKLSDFYIDNFRHDFGPKLFTMPTLIEDIFKDARVNIDDYFKYDKLDIACKYFWDDGYTFNAYSDNKRFTNEIQKKFSKEEKRVKNYISRSKKKFNLVKKIFLEKGPPFEIFNSKILELPLKHVQGPKIFVGVLTGPYRMGLTGAPFDFSLRGISDSPYQL